jgi:hypothetical protein
MSTVKVPEYIIAREVYEEAGIGYADFTDGGGAAGTYTCGFTLPVGFFIERCWLTDVTGFAGDTTAVITVGDGSDVDRLNTGTPSVFTAASYIDLGAVSGTALIGTEFKPVLTVTEDSDWGDVAAGELTVKVMGFMM